MILNDLGKKHGTDKCDIYHTYNGRTYLDIYDFYLSPLIFQSTSLLEIGVRDGASHRMWKEYLPYGQIVGVDIDPRCSVNNEDRISIVIGSQGEQSTVDKVAEICPEFNVILDDGSHVNELTIKSFELFFPKVKAGGLYIIEDLACSYLESELPDHVRQWPGMGYNRPEHLLNNKRSDLNDFFARLIKDMDTNRSGKIDFVHFYSKIVIIKKADI